MLFQNIDVGPWARHQLIRWTILDLVRQADNNPINNRYRHHDVSKNRSAASLRKRIFVAQAGSCNQESSPGCAELAKFRSLLVRKGDTAMPSRSPERSGHIGSRMLIEPVVLPLGNFYEDNQKLSGSAIRRRGLGSLALFDDSTISRILLNLIPQNPTPVDAREAARTLAQFSLASSATLAFASDDDIWRSVAFGLFPSSALCSFVHSWRQTAMTYLSSTHEQITQDRMLTVPLVRPRFYSDVLFHKQRCRTTPISPLWIEQNSIPRVSLRTLSYESFSAQFDIPRRPVILTDGMSNWASASWNPVQLSTDYTSEQFSAGGYKFTFRDYFRYASAVCEADDQAVYLFDATFAEKVPQLAKDYDVPHVFKEDLFAVLRSQRPHYRWLIAGPPRSGSSFHKDPNATSAWNAAIYGRKKWVFFPPHSTPPGILPSSDGSHVTAPVSVIEWFTNFYDKNTVLDAGGLEAIVHPGEIVYVPSGWWHCVLNLDMSIAITQNFVSEGNVVDVVRMFKNSPDQISGCSSNEQKEYISDNFAILAVEHRPHLRRRLSFALTPDANLHSIADVPEDNSVSSFKRRRVTSLWQSLQMTSRNPVVSGSKNVVSRSFSFGFG